jgi:F0F1-type ATP synthase membrane subunit b/b'
MTFVTKMRNAVMALPMKKPILLSVFALLSVGLLWKDALHFSIPVAFFVFIIGVWKLASSVVQQEIEAYQGQIQTELDNAQDALKEAKDRLMAAEKVHRELDLVLDSVLQSAHQEAAHILQKAEKDIDAMQENHRRQLDLENIVSRQKWKAVMAHDVLSAMRASISDQSKSGKHVSVATDSISAVVLRKISTSFSTKS